MWTYATCFQPFKNYFKFNIIFDTFHKYLADRKEHKYINMLQTTKSTSIIISKANCLWIPNPNDFFVETFLKYIYTLCLPPFYNSTLCVGSFSWFSSKCNTSKSCIKNLKLFQHKIDIFKVHLNFSILSILVKNDF